jgi:hypothetical protein
MGKKKPQTATITREYNFFTPPDTPDIRAFREFQPDTTLLDPSLAYQFAVAQRDIENRYASPFTGINNPVVSAALRDRALADLMEKRGTALRGGAFDVNRLRLAQLEALAGLTRPQLQMVKGTEPYGGGGPSTVGGIASGAGAVIGGIIAA